MPRRAQLLARAAPIALLLVAAAVLHLPQLLGERTYLRDTQNFYVPSKHYLAEVLRSGQLPQWWPWDGLGAPFLAQPMFSTFHPTTLLYLILPFWTAFAGQDLCGTLLALFGAYLLARALRQPRPSAVLAACLFAGNGFIMGLTEHTFMKLSAATLPWYLWALLLALRRGGQWLLAPAAVMGLILLAGDPQVAILASAAGFGLALAEQRSKRALLLGLLSPGGGAALAAIQVGPSLLLIDQTERETGAHGLDQWPFDLPHFVGMIVPLRTHGFAFHTELGLAALALVGASLVAVRRSPKVAALFAMAAVSLWLAAGDSYGLNALARHLVPIWGKLRYPIKSLSLAMLALPLLAGEGFRQLLSRKRRRKALLAAGVTGLLLAVVAGALLPMLPDVRSAPLLRSLGPGVAVVAALLMVPPRLGLLRWGAALFTGAQMLSFGARTLPTVPPSFYDEPPVVRALKNEGVGLTGPAFDRLDTHSPDAEETPARVARAGGGQNTLYSALFDLPVLTSYMPGTSMRLRRAWGSSIKPPDFARLAGILGVGYLVSSGFDRYGLDFLGADRTISTDPLFEDSVLHLRRSLPRSYAARKAEVIATPEQAGTRLRSEEFKPGREILIEGDSPRPDWTDRPEQLAVPATITSRTNSSVSISAELPWDGFVVLNETFFRGWTATVDGRRAPVLVANGFVRAVEAPAGRHTIVLRFRTPGLVAGAIISAVAWVLLVVGVVLMPRRRRAR